MRNTPSPKTVKIGEFTSMPLDEVRPYWRNPRRVTEQAVNMVAESMRYYGYQQPIVVDTDHVIIVGHTRYAALRRLGVKEVPVLVAKTLTPEQVKQYRLIDNRSGEFSTWDYGALIDELGNMETSVAHQFFPEMNESGVDRIIEDDALLEESWSQVETVVGFVCPSCYHEWEMDVTKEALLSGVLKVKDEGADQ
jgi:hypothetical protein